MATERHSIHDIPCGYAKAIMWALAGLTGLMMLALSIASNADRACQDNRNALTEVRSEIRTDIKYIRETLSRLERADRPGK